MAITADIDDLSAAEFLIMLSLNRKSGKLTAEQGEHKVVVTVRLGSIVYAASTSIRERVGSILVSRGLVTEAELHAALERQENEQGVKHLGNILVEMGVITEMALEEVVRGQFQKVLAELLSWQSGHLSFDRMEIPDLGAIRLDPREVLVDMGFETEQLVLGSISELEDGQKQQAAAEEEKNHREADTGTSDETPAEESAGESRGSSLRAYLREAISDDAHAVMRSMIDEMQSLSMSLTAEISMELLSRASRLVDRGVLMLVHQDHLAGSGGFGIDAGGGVTADVVRQLMIPRDEDTVFVAVIASRRSFKGPLERSVYNDLFVQQLGGALPDEIAAIPLVVNDEVAAVLYCDNATSGNPLGPVDAIEALMEATARALETSRT